MVIKKLTINELERVITSLEYHLEKYNDYQYKSNYARRKPDRSRALDNMLTHAQYIETELSVPYILGIIMAKDNNSYLFEDFNRYAGDDTPDYIQILKEELDKMKKENEKNL